MILCRALAFSHFAAATWPLPSTRSRLRSYLYLQVSRQPTTFNPATQIAYSLQCIPDNLQMNRSTQIRCALSTGRWIEHRQRRQQKYTIRNSSNPSTKRSQIWLACRLLCFPSVKYRKACSLLIPFQASADRQPPFCEWSLRYRKIRTSAWPASTKRTCGPGSLEYACQFRRSQASGVI